jgi:general stress protein 26
MLRDAERTLGNLIGKQTGALISSIGEDGFSNAKAMLPPRRREGIRAFYFTTNTSSMRIAQYRVNPKACAYFFDKRFFRGIMLKSTMEVLEDAAYKEMIWRDGDTLYYSKGSDQPGLLRPALHRHERSLLRQPELAGRQDMRFVIGEGRRNDGR